MLGIFSKKSDHPLADLKTAQHILDGIQKNDALNSVQELSGWIESIVELADDFRLDHEFSVLRMLDEAAQPYVRKLLRDYFTIQPLSKFQENRLWTVLNEYYKWSEIAHHDILTRFRNGGKGASGIKSELATLGARGIAALSGRLKLATARYALVEPMLWGHLADFYSHAEINGYQNDTATWYSGVPGGTTVKQEFSVLLVWYGVSAGNQSPLQEHISERLVAHVGKGLSVNNEFDGERLFVFDMAQPTPPMRATAEFTVHPSMRFLGTSDALNPLNGLLKTLEKGIVPDNLSFFGGSYEPELVREILRLLIDNLIQPPTRRNPRRKINVNLRVTSGFYMIVAQTDLGVDFTQDAEDVWEVEDISTTGFRSVVPASRADGIKIGSLIGSRPENVTFWGAGIVRRLSRDANNNLHIGVEVLSSQIVGVSLTDRIHNIGDEAQVAMYLSRPADTSGEAWLLMKPDAFSMNRSLNMDMGEKNYLLMPLELVESGDDYDLARYRLMQQDETAE